ncbi:response regulator transcription factor [Nitratifractor salsuginis]|uniref:response regulator transcription factor n=1 Tax=Nitratifractor salsuginis TaxID=269261 RepID=UPI0002FC6F91|nr:winged helix-turn-helix domain-containing protein [Nitratifractor salsuginis]
MKEGALLGIRFRIKKREELTEKDLQESRYEAVIVSMTTPGTVQNYLETIRKIRRYRSRVPIIAIDHFDSSSKIGNCLEAGCSDYIKPPVTNKEILMKLTFWIEWETPDRGRIVTLRNGYSFDLYKNELTHRQVPVTLSRQEGLFLHLLARYRGSFISAETLIDYIWGYGGDKNRLRVLVYKLRKKIATPLIIAMRGVGYKLENLSGELSPHCPVPGN